MKTLKKILSVLLSVLVVGAIFTACKGKEDNGGNNNSSNNAAVKSIRYLNFKPEIADKYQQIADDYEKETGIKVIVETAANNTYEQTLTAKMATDEAPTIFQINGPKGYNNWKDYCAELTNTEIYKHLNDKDMAVTSDGKVYGIPYVVEGYGIIYNSAITDKYFALDTKATNYSSMSEIKSFKALKELVEDMQKNKEALGIEGVFSSTSLKAGEDWRWQTHLANIPVYYEFKKNNVELTSDAAKKLNFEYAENYKNIFDLYTENSVSDKKDLGKKIVDESMAEFALGKSAMVQNGNWAWSQISDIQGNTVEENNIKFLPIYTGIDGEEKQGLCIGTENFLAINSKASEAEQKAAADFLYWLYSSEKGKNYVVNDLGFIAPFDTFGVDDTPKDPLAKEVVRYMNDKDINNIPWQFTVFPSQNFKEDFGSVLLQYAQGTKTFDDVKNTVVSKWETESNASK
ncbi:MAG: ABC transporter substrate-binding protein [Clostridiales bacterium]|nr:ABC transporter substrate-binding protein [Clostridiales bacterium]